ncbi:hypothetical protein M8C21_021730 [Ambrosia artemisiifolia]|uniref:Uncharacterized protein n=1 Tax=Ambrosia artemisiifolia TaxID=4212 RepID=A0AAD5CRF4_AMBAR|nr:hypothetical protein M8C21_021730 [Ambrosia artemisiifolia]
MPRFSTWYVRSETRYEHDPGTLGIAFPTTRRTFQKSYSIVSQLGNAAQKYQTSTQNASSSLSLPELQNNCNMFVASARQLAKALEVPLVNDLGYTKRYVRCLQISEVVNSMKDLIDYSRETRTGPMACIHGTINLWYILGTAESLSKFPRRTSSTPRLHGQSQQPEEQQTSAMQIASTNGVMPSVNNKSNSTVPTSSNTTIGSLLHQNSMNSRHQNPLSNRNRPYGGSIQISSPGSSSTVPPPHPNSSPFQSPTTPSSLSNNASALAPSGVHLNSPNISMTEADTNDSQSDVQKVIQEMMMSSQLGGGSGIGSAGTDMRNSNGLVEAGYNNSCSGVVGNGQTGMVKGVRGAMGHNSSLNMNGRVTMQQDLGSQLLNGHGAVNNGFNNLPFDWKPSP